MDAAVLHRLDGLGQLHQFASGSIRIAQRQISRLHALCCCLNLLHILLVRVYRAVALHRLRLIPWRAHPDIALPDELALYGVGIGEGEAQMNFTPQAFYLYPSVAGLIGRKTSSGQVLKSDLDVSLYLLEQGVPSL